MTGAWISISADRFVTDNPREEIVSVVSALFHHNENKTPDWPYLTRIVLGEVRIVEGS